MGDFRREAVIEVGLELERAVPWCFRINTPWGTSGKEGARHHGLVNRSFVARDPHGPVCLNESGTGRVNRSGASGIVPMVERDRSGFYDDQHGTRMIVPT